MHEWPQNGVSYGPKYGKQLGDALDSFRFLKVFYRFFMAIIIPKWLIPDSGWIAILFLDVFATSKKNTKSAPFDSLFITKIL